MVAFVTVAAILIALLGAITGKWAFLAFALILFLPAILGAGIAFTFADIPTVVWFVIVLIIVIKLTGGKK